MVPLYEKDFLVMSYDPTINSIVAVWTGFLKYEETVEALDLALRYIRQYKVSGWIDDTRKEKVMLKELADYIDNDWYPQAVALGLRRNAFLYPENIFAQARIARKIEVNQNTDDSDLKIAEFKTMEEAYQWIKSV